MSAADAIVDPDRLYQLVMDAPIAMAILRGPELRFDIVNEHFEKIFGGRKLRGLRQCELDPDGEHLGPVLQVFQTGVTISRKAYPVEHAWAGGERTTRYFDYTLSPLRDATGTIEGVLSFTIDVTDMVMVNRRLEEARQQAELANRAKDEFLAMLGHELRNPLAPILTALHLMQLRAPDTCGRERAVIERQVKHVVRLVEDLLDVSRITRGKIELRKELIEISTVIAKAIEMASPLLEQRQHRLRVAVPQGLETYGDQMRLAQVFANLLTNAAKYTEPGGDIEIIAERIVDRLVLRVRDTGIGIAPDMLPHVFDMFVQEHQALDRAQGGLGLGLAIARSIVEMHAGAIRVSSDGLGKGSEFAVELPAAEPRATIDRPRVVPAGTVASRPEHVLVVDDNPDALDMLADGLEAAGFQTSRAHDGPSALAIASKVHPQLALLDLGLPVMDGYELARRLREADHDLKLVAITGYGHATALSKSQAAGFQAHLVKPITLEEVQATIDQLTR